MGNLFTWAIYQAQKYLENQKIFDSDPEWAHHDAIRMAQIFDDSVFAKGILETMIGYEHPSLKQELRWQEYKNPIGLAAWFTKEAHGMQFLEQFGFGYMVIGWVTGNAQEGNPKQRLFRYTNLGSIVNRMWLPGIGVDAMALKLAKMKLNKQRPTVPIWINVANSLKTNIDDKPIEISMIIQKLYPYADVRELNASCPNQKWVTYIQKGWWLKEMIQSSQLANEKMALAHRVAKKPIVVKIWPLTSYPEDHEKQQDLTIEDLEHIVDVCITCKVDGIVTTNTAKEHIGIPKEQDKIWGMSGALLREKSLMTAKTVKDMIGTNSDIKLIWVGGIGTGKTQKEIWKSSVDMMHVGADLQQMLTGFVMWGTVVAPRIIKEALVKYKKNT